MMHPGWQLRAKRIKLGLSQYDLERMAKVSRIQIINIEKGIANPRFDTLIKLCAALKLKVTIS